MRGKKEKKVEIITAGENYEVFEVHSLKCKCFFLSQKIKNSLKETRFVHNEVNAK